MASINVLRQSSLVCPEVIPILKRNGVRKPLLCLRQGSLGCYSDPFSIQRITWLSSRFFGKHGHSRTSPSEVLLGFSFLLLAVAAVVFTGGRLFAEPN